MKNKKKIVFFNGFYLPHLGGVERYTNSIVKELKKYYDVVIVTANVPTSENYEEIDGVQVYRLPVYKPCCNRYPLLKKNAIYKKIVNEIKSMDISHIICNTRYYQTTMLGVKIAKEFNIDLSIIDHSSSHVSLSNKFIDFFGNKYEDYLTRKIMKVKPRFYGVSKRCNEWLKYYNIEASGVFYNSIDKVDINKKKVANTIKIGYVGRIIPEKGVLNLVKAYYELKDKYNIELVIAGDGNYLSYLKENYPDVTYTGSLDHDKVMDLLKDLDVFVHPSMYPEGLPTSILEAGMMKCAVLATDRGGTKEVIANDDVGIIIEENVSDLVKQLKRLLDDKKLIKFYQDNIYKRICGNFTWKSTTEYIRKELEKYE